MLERRDLLTFAGGAVIGGVTVSFLDKGSGSIRWYNGTDETLWTEIEIQSKGGVLFSPETIYEDSSELPQTPEYMFSVPNIVPAGDYIVKIEVRRNWNESIAASETITWNGSGQEHALLTIEIDSDLNIETIQ